MTHLLPAADNPLVQRLGWTLVHFVWQGALLGACIGLVLVIMRRAASHARYNLLLAAFTLLALAPVVTFFVVTPETSPAVAATTAVEPSVSATIPPAPIAMTDNAGAFPPVEPIGLEPDLPPLPPGDAFRIAQVSQQATAEPPVEERPLAERVAPVLPYLVAGWLLGVVLL